MILKETKSGMHMRGQNNTTPKIFEKRVWADSIRKKKNETDQKSADTAMLKL